MGRRLAIATWAALLVLATAPAVATEPADAVPETTVMIVEFPRGAPYIGLPSRCPGAPPDADLAEQICLAEI
jgi:hypothetical protein